MKDKNIPVINLSARHVLMGVFSKTSFENHLSRNLLKSSLKKYFGVLQNLSYMLEEKKTEKSGKIAFIGVPRHLRQLIPVAKIFIDNSYHPLILSSGITRLSEFRRYGMEATYLESYLTIKILKILHKDLQKTIENWVSTLQEKISQERLVYNEIPLWPIIKDQFPTLCVSLFSEAFKHIKIFEEIIKEENIQLAVFGNQVCLKERTAVAVMNTYGIPTLLIQDGIVGGSYAFAPLHTTKMVVWGNLSRNNLLNCGISHEKLIITGCPRFDDLVNNNAKSFEKEIFDKLSIKKKMNGFMVFATNPIPDIKNDQLISTVYASSKSFPNIKLVVKLHPGEPGNLQREIAKRLKVAPIIIKNIDLYHLLNTAKLIITYHSTVGLEAMILDKPVIIVNLFETKYPIPYVSSGAAMGVYKPEDLVPAIKRVLFDKDTQQELAKRRKEFVYEYAYKMDGKASERVADLIEKMIEEGKENKLK